MAAMQQVRTTAARYAEANGLLAQGKVAIAMALSVQLVYDGLAIDLAYTAVLVSVALHEVIAPRLLRGLLIDASELREDTPLVHGRA